MEDVIKEEKNKSEVKNTDKKKFTILGFSIWRIFAYFIIYSVLGFVIETVYGMITKGMIESRQSFLYGPFCSIYGLGAVVMIIFLQYFNQNNNRLFIGGFIIGSIVEYFISWFGQTFLHIKWWDYSNMPLNINGRICVFFSLFWGFLAIYLISYVNPKVDKFIDWIKAKTSMKMLKIITTFTIIFLTFDCIITAVAIETFFVRKVHDYDLQVSNKNKIIEMYDKIYKDEKINKFIMKYFSDEKLIKTFPNLKTQATNGDMIYFDCYVNGIKPYYYKFNSTLRGDIVKVLKHENRIENEDINIKGE